MNESDIVVVGAGCMGAATAYHLLQCRPSLRVTVYDRDLTLARASTLLSDGNVRIQFNLEENILISRYAMEVLESFGDQMAVDGYRPDVGMKKQGNLFFVDEENLDAARQGLELQRSLGCNVEWLDMETIRQRYPVLDSDRFVGGTFGPDDGAVDPTAVTTGYRRAAEARGARFVQAEVEALETADERVTGVRLADGAVHTASTVVVCGGAWSTSLLATAGVEIPVEPVMRTVYVVRSDVADGEMLPSFFLPSGVYVISENPDTFFIAWVAVRRPRRLRLHPRRPVPVLRGHLAGAGGGDARLRPDGSRQVVGRPLRPEHAGRQRHHRRVARRVRPLSSDGLLRPRLPAVPRRRPLPSPRRSSARSRSSTCHASGPSGSSKIVLCSSTPGASSDAWKNSPSTYWRTGRTGTNGPATGSPPASAIGHGPSPAGGSGACRRVSSVSFPMT